MRPNPKAMILINQLMAESREDTRKAAYAFFNKCDYADLINEGSCVVDIDRCDSFLEYAKAKGVTPSGGAFTQDMKAQYFYV
jgi:hypothetical protein